MRIMLLNPPFHSLTSKRGVGEQVPYGLLLVGGALIDAGHDVLLVDAEAEHLEQATILAKIQAFAPDVVMTGHAGSTAAHPVIVRTANAIKKQYPDIVIVYGGVFPTYHSREILARESGFDIIVRGEGERIAVDLVAALSNESGLTNVKGIDYRDEAIIHSTPPAEMIADLNTLHAGWELIDDWDIYRCWGLGRAAIVQFSRGCPHQCTYCGQRGFWTKWRYRDPHRTAEEIAWLYHEKGVHFIDLADENPTSSKRIWQTFLEAVIAHQLPVKMFTTIRAADVVRDADILHLYKQAGIECVLMGMETTDPATMVKIKKGSTTRHDYDAIRLLRDAGILSMVGHIVGFEEERLRDYWNAIRQLVAYDPDLVNAMYVTPHRWTDFYRENQTREVVEYDQAKWDYRHQVLGTRYLKPWHILLLVKIMELVVHVRPKVLARLLFYRDKDQRRAYRWCFRYSGNVWLFEILEFVRTHLFAPKQPGSTLKEHMGAHITQEAPLVPAAQIRTPFHRG